ncbi:MAG: hypothetical protein WC264_02000 [Candidatus Paceibacterota bacterium]|jgi:hypothetical protein
MNRFESYENFEDKNEFYERMAWFLYAQRHSGEFFSNTEKELLVFLQNANQEEKEEVKQLADIIEKYLIYINKNAKDEQKKQIESEMEKNFKMKDYIERHYAGKLAENYSCGLRHLGIMKK